MVGIVSCWASSFRTSEDEGDDLPLSLYTFRKKDLRMFVNSRPRTEAAIVISRCSHCPLYALVLVSQSSPCQFWPAV